MKFKKIVILGIVLLMLLTIFSFGINRNITLADGEVLITTWAELNAVRDNLSGSYILMNDLDETTAGYDTYASSLANSGAGWTPIGTFSGNFDGNNYTITGLYINRPLADNVGLINPTSTAEIRNVGLIDIDVTGGNYVGGLSSGNSGTIINAYVTGTVRGIDYVGGLVGSNGGIINNSYSSGTVTGTNRVGGLVGQDFSGTTSNSYSTATVNGISFVGGLYGWNQGTINSSYSTGAVSGTESVGGLVGISGTNINNSYSTGNITRNSGSNTNFGGFVGWQTGWTITNSYSTGTVSYTGFNNPTNKGFAGLASGTITNCFWDMETSDQATSAGAATGKTTEQMKTANTFTDAAWDFVNIWAMGSERNNGYVYLQSIAPIAIWTLTYTAGENGSITGSSPQTVNNGEDGATVTAVPDEGYVFVNWSDESTENPRTDISVAVNITVTANFAINEVNEEEGGVGEKEEEENINKDKEDNTIDNTEDTDVVSHIERAKISSWKARIYEDLDSKLCTTKVRFEIKGKYFDSDAEVKVGGKKPFNIDRKSSKKIIARFCYDKFFQNKTSFRKTVKITNPGAESEKADKKYDPRTTKNIFNKKQLSMNSTEGIINIQKALIQLGYLDSQYDTGIYGPLTTEAVRKFQADNGIEQVGIVGPLTRAKLAEKLR